VMKITSNYSEEIMNKLLDDQAYLIAKYINNGELSLFCGAGITSVTWNNLYADKEFRKKNLSNYVKLQLIANKQTDFTDFIRLMKESLDTSKLNGDYLNILLNLNIKHIWTTNFDKNIENVLVHNNINYDSISKESKLKNIESSNKKVVYKINGDIDDLENAVLTQEQYEKHQERMNLFSSFLEKELLIKKFLIIGYSFTDNIVLKSIAKLNNYFPNATNECFNIIDKKTWKEKRLFFEDLKKRYNITPVILNSYSNADINSFIEKIKYYCFINNIYVSGTLNLEKNRNDLQLIKNINTFFDGLFSKKFKIYSNHGEFLGYHLGASATRYAYKNNININEITNIIPIYVDEHSERYRKSSISNTSYTIIMFSNDDIAHGMIEEFIISYDNNNLIIPLFFTGKTPNIIYQFMKENKILFPELDPYWNDLEKMTTLENSLPIITNIIKHKQSEHLKFNRNQSIKESIYEFLKKWHNNKL